MSLLWLVSLANASVLVALLLLTFSPIEIDAPIETDQLALLPAGFVVLVALNLVLLRRVLSDHCSSPGCTDRAPLAEPERRHGPVASRP